MHLTARLRPFPWRRYLARTLLAALGLALAGAAFEYAVRRAQPPPSTQVVRPTRAGASRGSPRISTGLRMLRGVPVWGDAGREGRECVAAHPERRRALFFGDSITYGIGLQNEELFTNLVEARLNAAQPAPGWCVMNFAQPGYGFEQSLAVAREEIPRQRPAVVFFEFWAIGRSYRMLGDSAYDVDAYRLRGDGFPAVRYGWLIPDALNRWLFTRSAGYQFLALTYGDIVPAERDERNRRFSRRLEATLPPLLHAVGARGVYFLGTPLHQPFARSITDAFQLQWTSAVLEAARRSGIPAIRLEEALRAEDHLALRQDPCCHFNAAGHRAIAEVLARAALE